MIGAPGAILTLGLGGSPSLMTLLGFTSGSSTSVTISVLQPYITVYFWKRIA